MEKQIYPVCLFQLLSVTKLSTTLNHSKLGKKKLIKSFITTTTT